ncbi:MAG: S1 RNA-binding domain-containing protein, partial [SAR324 cluster bacterium]|nr:S1 RNA-binding domain-containing protein [SAR324 cluster bacterium]
TEDPWKNLEDKIHINDEVIGRVVNVTDFGIFVEVMEGVEGLVHVSEIDADIPKDKIQEFYKVNSLIRAKVLKIDVDERRLGLSIIGLVEDPEEIGAQSAVLKDALTDAGIIAEQEEAAPQDSTTPAEAQPESGAEPPAEAQPESGAEPPAEVQPEADQAPEPAESQPESGAEPPAAADGKQAADEADAEPPADVAAEAEPTPEPAKAKSRKPRAKAAKAPPEETSGDGEEAQAASGSTLTDAPETPSPNSKSGKPAEAEEAAAEE